MLRVHYRFRERRRYSVTTLQVLLAGICMALSGCGDGGESAGVKNSEEPASDFPVSISTVLGETVINEPPERVITLIDDEFVIALGVVPVAMSRAPTPAGVSDTMAEALGDEKPILLDVSAGWPYEQLAELEPDLIIGGITRQDYDQLAAIAPTLPYEESSTTESWQQRQRTVGRALGRSQEAEQLVESVEAQIARVAESVPRGLRDKSFSIAFAHQQGAVSVIRDPNEAAARLLAEIGLTLAPESEALTNPDGSGRVTLNLESLDKLRADVIFVSGVDEALVDQVTENPVFEAMLADNPGTTVVVLPLPLLMPLVRPSALTAKQVLTEVVGLWDNA